MNSLSAEDVGLPRFDLDNSLLKKAEKVSSFDLSSHARARHAIAFGLKMRSGHVFVVGADRSGRMTATMDYLQKYITQLPPPPDWVYLNNFSFPHRPLPYRLPTGMGLRLKTAMKDLISTVQDVFQKTFNGQPFMEEVGSLALGLQTEVADQIADIQKRALAKGLMIEEENEQFIISPLESAPADSPPKYTPQDLQELRQALAMVTGHIQLRSYELNQQLKMKRRQQAEFILQPIMRLFVEEFAPYIKDWIDDLAGDIIEHVDQFATATPTTDLSEFFGRYDVNVVINNRYSHHPSVVLEPSPTYENMFGSLKYKSSATGYATDFTLIRGGSLHRANGGILVIRAESLAANPDVWNALKSAIRDNIIRIEERHRGENAIPLLEAPEPKGITMDVQIFIVGAPAWYYAFFYNDPDFKTYFKTKADIEPYLPATVDNVALYARLIAQLSKEHIKKQIDIEAIEYLLGYSARWAAHRHQLSSKFEIIADMLTEANILSLEENANHISIDHIRGAIRNRRFRNSSLEDRSHRDIEKGMILIDTKGVAVGQINGLSILSEGDHQFGLPNRITARTYRSKKGLINIERLTRMGGPIQQKGALILEGFLNGLLGQEEEFNYGVSMTFEQSYSEIDGDSASLAELLAILSSLSGIPLRQDIAVTGSVNQFGQVQAVGGVHHKIEGFFRVCKTQGLTGVQGVVIPKSNTQNVILREEVTERIAHGDFSIYSVQTLNEAIGILFKPQKLSSRDKIDLNFIIKRIKKNKKYGAPEKNRTPNL